MCDRNGLTSGPTQCQLDDGGGGDENYDDIKQYCLDFAQQAL